MSEHNVNIACFLVYSTVRDIILSVIDHCDKRITLLSDTDISSGLFNLFTYFDTCMPLE